MRQLPTGTVTLLFSNIEGSTALLGRLGERYGEALSQQRALMRAAVSASGGREMEADIAAICGRLDGLPLAIELAAARIRLLAPRALLGRLSHSIDLAAADVGQPSRQQTLRSTIAWSYDLLAPDLAGAFRRAGVFAGGCDLDALAAVAAPGHGPQTGSDPLQVAAGLLDVSLITVTDGPDGEPRVGMLETIREYALERLEQAGDLDDTRRRHAEYYAGVAERADEQREATAQRSGPPWTGWRPSMTTCAPPWPGRCTPPPRARRPPTASGPLPACGWPRRWPISGTGMATPPKGGGGCSGPPTWPPRTAGRSWPSWRTGSGSCSSCRASRTPRYGSWSAAWRSGVTSATGSSRHENSTASGSPAITSATWTPRGPCWRKAPPSPARSAATTGSPRP